MVASEHPQLDERYARHLKALQLQGKAPAKVDRYARALRRITACLARSRIRRVACATTAFCTPTPNVHHEFS